MKRVAVKFQDRAVLLNIDVRDGASELDSLKAQFIAFCGKDPYLRNKLSTHFAIFEFLDTEFGEIFEVPPETLILPSNSFTVRLCPIHSPTKVIIKY
jgi:hypothetical protein